MTNPTETNNLPDIWEEFDTDVKPLMPGNEDLLELDPKKAKRGQAFTEADRREISTSIRRLIEKHLLPSIGRRIRFSESNVANTRKGIKNTFKMLWKKAERG